MLRKRTMSKPEGYPATPELDKLKALQGETQPIGNFLDWLLHEKGYSICELDSHGESVIVSSSIETFLADYFKIDRKKVEEEKQAILEWMRNQQ
jgi:hypothetical protein